MLLTDQMVLAGHFSDKFVVHDEVSSESFLGSRRESTGDDGHKHPHSCRPEHPSGSKVQS